MHLCFCLGVTEEKREGVFVSTSSGRRHVVTALGAYIGDSPEQMLVAGMYASPGSAGKMGHPIYGCNITGDDLDDPMFRCQPESGTAFTQLILQELYEPGPEKRGKKRRSSKKALKEKLAGLKV